MSTPTPADLAAQTYAERERLANLLGGLGPEQWDTASLCEGWRVREVVAHMTMPFRTKPLALLTGMVAAGFSFNRFANRDARAVAHRLNERDLVDLLHANIDHPWSPPGGGAVGALSHDLIHGLDFTEPLGLPAPPAERIATVLRSTSGRQIRYFRVSLDGHRLVAADAAAAVGEGPTELQLPAKEILLVITGRRALSDVAT